MHAPGNAFWKHRNPATEGPMRSLLTIETTCFHHRHGAGQPERVSAESWTLDQVLFDAPAMPRSNSTFSTTKNSPPNAYPGVPGNTRSSDPLLWHAAESSTLP